MRAEAAANAAAVQLGAHQRRGGWEAAVFLLHTAPEGRGLSSYWP